MGLTIEELEARDAEYAKTADQRRRERYALARKLGFTASESRILQSRQREVIISLAIERGLITNADDPKAA